MSWRWEQLPPPGTRSRVHLIAFSREPKLGLHPLAIEPAQRELAYRDLGIDVGTSQYGTPLTTQVVNPTNLEHLRDAWRAAASLSPDFVLDVLSQRWWTTLPTDFFVENELSLNFEGQPTGTLGHLAHTLGMEKFGRPELAIAGLEPDDGPLGAELLLKAARILASGATLKIGPRIFDGLRIERNLLPIAPQHLVLRDAGMGPPVIRKYLAARR